MQEGEDHLQITRPFGAKVDREISTAKKQPPGFGGHPPSSWQLQKHHSIDKLNLKPGYSEGFVSTLSGLPANPSSLAVKKGNQSFTSNAVVGMAKFVGQQFDSGAIIGQQNFALNEYGVLLLEVMETVAAKVTAQKGIQFPQNQIVVPQI